MKDSRKPQVVPPIRFWVESILGCTLCVFLLAATADAQISPGALSKAHESLSGPLNCTKCHDLGTHGIQLKCMDCHTEIRQRVAARQGMHGFWLPKDATGKDCVSCHSEHNGTDFALIHWQPNRESIDHSKTGFALTGKHATTDCNDCHKAANISPSARAGIFVKDLNRTYLGLSKECISCHADEHRGQVGTNCAACHTTIEWKFAASFNHATAKFQLTGAHATVTCDKCHTTVNDPKPYVKYTGIPFAKCTDCHEDPHKGSFTAPCQSCHNTTSWTRVGEIEGFDHSKTAFPLLGKHRAVPCSDCHAHSDFKAPVAHALCMDCHNPDPHKGQFETRASKGECAECHTVEGWKPSTFGVKEHASAPYPLLGKHASVECSKCHLPAGANTVFKVKFAQCADCHQDAHDGQFAKAPYDGRCEFCHTVNEFHRSKFTVAMHRNTRFPLEGEHAVVLCNQCHKEGADRRTDHVLPFQFKDMSCAACHMDPHHGSFNDRMAEKSANGTPLGCAACHNVNSWIDAKGFDHSATAFPLLGAHRIVACSACHVAPPNSDEAVFKGTATSCEACHTDPHAGQFAKDKKTDCNDCHNSERWQPSTFDHDKRTSFPLTGGHAGVACEACHKQTQLLGKDAVIIYRLAPTKCSSCHGEPDPRL